MNWELAKIHAHLTKLMGLMHANLPLWVTNIILIRAKTHRLDIAGQLVAIVNVIAIAIAAPIETHFWCIGDARVISDYFPFPKPISELLNKLAAVTRPAKCVCVCANTWHTHAHTVAQNLNWACKRRENLKEVEKGKRHARRKKKRKKETNWTNESYRDEMKWNEMKRSET